MILEGSFESRIKWLLIPAHPAFKEWYALPTCRDPWLLCTHSTQPLCIRVRSVVELTRLREHCHATGTTTLGAFQPHAQYARSLSDGRISWFAMPGYTKHRQHLSCAAAVTQLVMPVIVFASSAMDSSNALLVWLQTHCAHIQETVAALAFESRIQHCRQTNRAMMLRSSAGMTRLTRSMNEKIWSPTV